MSVSTTAGSRQRVLLVDNLDSFTGSIASYLRAAGAEVEVRRVPVALDGFDRIVLSPGPGRPADFPWMAEVLATARVPVFGVWRGMQAIAEHFGGRIVAARRIVHGRTSWIHHRGVGVFTGLPSPLRQTRYHSLAVADLPDVLEVTARTRDGEIMALRHRERPIEGVQFHPESVRSQLGMALLRRVLS